MEENASNTRERSGGALGFLLLKSSVLRKKKPTFLVSIRVVEVLVEFFPLKRHSVASEEIRRRRRSNSRRKKGKTASWLQSLPLLDIYVYYNSIQTTYSNFWTTSWTRQGTTPFFLSTSKLPKLKQVRLYPGTRARMWKNLKHTHEYSYLPNKQGWNAKTGEVSMNAASTPCLRLCPCSVPNNY